MRVFWTPEARARLLEIQAYIARDSPAGARRVAAQLLRRSRQLAVPPTLGRRLPKYPEAELREILIRPFRMIFRVTAAQIQIITIKHYRQKLPKSEQRLR